MIVKVSYNLSQFNYINITNCDRLTKKRKEEIKEKLIDKLGSKNLSIIVKIRGAEIQRAKEKEVEKYLYENYINIDILEKIKL